jgi:hypothetical protein
MADTSFTFPCPCCGKLIEVDTRSGKARAVRAEEAKGGRDLDTLLRAHGKEHERLGGLFDSARDDQKRQADQLEAKLRRAKDEAKKDKDTRPRNPFDLE